MSFAAQLQAIADKNKTKVDTLVRKVTVDMASEMILRSPVGNRELWAVNIDRKSRGLPLTPAGYVGGRFRNNWMFGAGNPDTGTNNQTDPSGSASLSRLSAAISAASMGSAWYITNSLPYARRLEYGHSTQAPEGFVRLTVQRWQEHVARTARELRSE